MKQEKTFRFGGGLISVATVLVILLLSSFAVLTKVTAAAEKSLADRAEQAAVDYYAAEKYCAETAAEISELLMSGKEPDGLCTVEQTESGLLLTVTAPIDENRQLETVWLADDRGRMTQVSSKSVAADIWEEEILDVWSGN